MDKVTHSIREYIEKNGKRADVYWRMTNSVLKFSHNGKWYSEDMFEKMFPKYQYKKCNGKGENPNTKSFL